MTLTYDKRLRRQAAYRTRAGRARFFGRLLVPVLFLTMSAAIWQEPRLANKLEEGFEVLAPVAGQYAPVVKQWVSQFSETASDKVATLTGEGAKFIRAATPSVGGN